jgi:hypothetical protein
LAAAFKESVEIDTAVDVELTLPPIVTNTDVAVEVDLILSPTAPNNDGFDASDIKSTHTPIIVTNGNSKF